jgi:hypothetical protein
MSIFDRFKSSPDPQEPASPPPFRITDRVIVSGAALDGMFTAGLHGAVVNVEFTTDENDPYGPWVIMVAPDGLRDILKFHAAELTREPKHAAPAAPPVVTVTQPEDEAYSPQGEVPSDDLAGWIQRAKELRHETVFTDTPVYDDVSASAMARDGLAYEVEAWLATQSGGAA